MHGTLSRALSRNLCFEKRFARNYGILATSKYRSSSSSSGISSSNRMGALNKVNFGSRRELTMDESALGPPGDLHGMKVLDKDAFNKSLVVLSLTVDETKLKELTKDLKRYMLKCCMFKAIRETERERVKKVLFDPRAARKVSDFDEDSRRTFERLSLAEDSFDHVTITLGYDNWNAETVLKAILPENEPPLTSFSLVGHIIHVNLKPHLLEYKSIIGQVLLDKFSQIKTVVNKINRIDSKYRNFEMELLAGVPDYVVRAKENGCTFEMDFSAVYWNPRLGTEHSRVIESLTQGDVLFDVFCGIGPFSVPAARKKCKVFANDLNPESFKWLQRNITLNKVKSDYVQVFNKDGADFIRDDVKANLIRVWRNEDFIHKIVIVMNLPASALTFLKCFKGLFDANSFPGDAESAKKHLPIVHCYFFAESNTSRGSVESFVEEQSGMHLKDVEEYAIHNVRNVSKSKDMYKIQFKLPFEYLFSKSNAHDDVIEEPKAKRVCQSK